MTDYSGFNAGVAGISNGSFGEGVYAEAHDGIYATGSSLAGNLMATCR
jgi:hypothetical protein